MQAPYYSDTFTTINNVLVHIYTLEGVIYIQRVDTSAVHRPRRRLYFNSLEEVLNSIKENKPANGFDFWKSIIDEL